VVTDQQVRRLRKLMRTEKTKAAAADKVAVGMPVARHPLHRSVRALLTHTAFTLSVWRRSVLRDKGELCEPVGADCPGIDQTSAS
jgi:hypothetical protein